MPWYELFCLARPQLARVQQAELLKTAASAVFNGGGVVADLKSFGERRLAYDVREAGNKWSEVSNVPFRLLNPPGLPHRACFLIYACLSAILRSKRS